MQEPVSPSTDPCNRRLSERGAVTAVLAAGTGLSLIWLLRPYNDMFLENTGKSGVVMERQ